ncbi:MAG: GNAT family N-acetyltransferase [Roseburia sp.]|nr:GNAT family N-acetyltransferase [Roseburia sp.]
MELIKIREHEELAERAAEWFYRKWGVPMASYLDSIQACIAGKECVPQWYLAMDGDAIVGGLGVIENDFHDREDLAPNVCAVYVEENYRCQGLAGRLLALVCDDMAGYGIKTLYLITDRTSFYERYGWEFLCMVQGDDEPAKTRMYIHRQE